MNRLTRLLGIVSALAFASASATALAARPPADPAAPPPPQTIMLKVNVGADGKVLSATPVDPNAAPALNQAAQAMALKLPFTPARKDGVAVPSQTHLSLLLALEPAGAGKYALALKRAHNSPGVARVGKMDPPKYPGGGAVVVVAVTIDADGKPDMGTLATEGVQMRVPSKFAEARYVDAITVSVRGSRFLPDQVDGVAVASRVVLPYQFGGGASRRGNDAEDETPLVSPEDAPVMHAVSMVPGVELPKIDIKAAPSAAAVKP